MSAQYILRGDVFFAELPPTVGSEQGGTRPVIVLQNDTGNKHSPTVIVAPLTTSKIKHRLPTHVEVNSGEAGLTRHSTAMLEQIKTIDKKRLKEKMGHLTDELMDAIKTAAKISMDLW